MSGHLTQVLLYVIFLHQMSFAKMSLAIPNLNPFPTIYDKYLLLSHLLTYFDSLYRKKYVQYPYQTVPFNRSSLIWPQGYKTFFMLTSTENKIWTANKN